MERSNYEPEVRKMYNRGPRSIISKKDLEMELKFNDIDKISNENCCNRAFRNIMNVTS